MCKFSSKSGGVPFQISFFLGDLTRNDPKGKQYEGSISPSSTYTMLVYYGNMCGPS